MQPWNRWLHRSNEKKRNSQRKICKAPEFRGLFFIFRVMRKTIITVAAVCFLTACGTGNKRAGGRVVQRTQAPGDSLVVAYEFEVDGSRYQGNSVLAPGAVLPSDSVEVVFEEGTPQKCRLVMPSE